MVKFLSYTKKALPFLALLLVAWATKALAIDTPSGVPTTFIDLNQTISTIFNVVIIVSAIIFVILFLIGGIQYLTSAGNEETAKNARKVLLNAVIGLVIVLAAWGVGSWVITTLTEGEVDIEDVQ